MFYKWHERKTVPTVGDTLKVFVILTPLHHRVPRTSQSDIVYHDFWNKTDIQADSSSCGYPASPGACLCAKYKKPMDDSALTRKMTSNHRW